MVQTGQPIRVVYAKLTSTGAYDVVAKTANVALDRARTLAERLLPGNPPLDAIVGDEVAHMRPAEGGHVVLRFARYDWTDGERGDVYITDIVWVSDEDFLRTRNNAFALVPRTDQVFDVLAELPAVAVPERTLAQDLARVSELREIASEAKTVIASTAAADSVLLVHGGDRARAMELFTLLLPPGLRTRLTFQTQTFRVPAVLPRVTLVDRAYANLRDAGWTVLPSVDVAVPLELAGRLVALADDPESLGLAHDLYDDAYDDAADLRTSILRLTRLAPIAAALRASDALRALRLVVSADPHERGALMRRITETFDAGALRRGLVQLQQEGGDIVTLLRALDGAAGDAETTAALVDSLPGTAAEELVVELAARAARHGDLPRLIALMGADRRTVAARLPLDDERIPEQVRRLVRAIRDASGARQDFDATARLLAEAEAMRLSGPAATGLNRMCRDAIADALERTHASAAAVVGLRRLQDASTSYVAAQGANAALPAVLAPHELAAADAVDIAASFAASSADPVRAVVGVALLTRAWEAHRSGDEQQCRRMSACAVTLLSRAGSAGRELARQVLEEHNVREHDLVGMPGADALFPLLGGNAQQAALVARIVTAIGTLSSAPEEGVRELASAVFAAHAQRIRITPQSEISQRVLGALRAHAAVRHDRTAAAATELGVELLAVITDPLHMQVLEDAALGDSMVIRLQRLDRSVAQCRAAEDEDRYERLALALEQPDVPLDGAVRERLRDALGTRGLKRRLLRVVSSVIERDAS